jgi:HD-GYP domain-containing protein (c-di-GMP phosphodiesterase class II)
VNYLLLHSDVWSPAPLAPVLEAARVATQGIHAARELVPNERPTVFVLDPESRGVFPLDSLRAFVDAGGAIVALGAAGETDVPEGLPPELLSGFLAEPVGVRQLLVAIRAGYREAAARAETARARAEAALRSQEIGELTRIGVALGSERDVEKVLEMILKQAQRITQSDGGSLYLVETDEESGVRRLRFRLAENRSIPDVPFVTFTIPLDRTSLAGYAAVTGDPLVIDDAYFLPPDVEYTINRSFDERYGYRTKSMVVIPMKDHKEVIVGVLQLINRKRDFQVRLAGPEDIERQVVPYSKRTVELVTALAGQAAVAIENSLLLKRIEKMFEGFVDAAVQAIEQRDPTTFGHSGRVAGYTVNLAQVVDRADDGLYREVRFTSEQIRELRYAALLHDFGKVGVREKVLVKAKKLYPPDLELIKQRHAFIRRTLESEHWRRRAEYLETKGREGYDEVLAALQTGHTEQTAELDRFLELVLKANEPSLLPEGDFQELTTIAERTYEGVAGDPLPLLTGDEVRFLTIRKGSLDNAEWEEMQSHVTHTYRFLQEIPWTRELQQIPIIAYGHHEKLDGSGYPRRISGDAIPIQTRMMTISDIYDALTAQDRPYKPAMAPDRALDLLTREFVDRGQLDNELFRLFVEGKAFESGSA